MGALAPAARLGRADSRRPGHRQERRGRAVVVDRRRRAAHRIGSGAPRDRPARMEPLRGTRARGAAASARSALRDRRAGAARQPDDPAAHRRARARRRGARRHLGRARGARARLPRRRGRRQRAALARALGLQPRAHAGDGRRLHVRGRHARPDRRDGCAGPVRAVARDACRSAVVQVPRRRGGAHEERRHPARPHVRPDRAAQRPAAHRLRRRSLRRQARGDRARAGVARYKAMVEGEERAARHQCHRPRRIRSATS